MKIPGRVKLWGGLWFAGVLFAYALLHTVEITDKVDSTAQVLTIIYLTLFGIGTLLALIVSIAVYFEDISNWADENL